MLLGKRSHRRFMRQVGLHRPNCKKRNIWPAHVEGPRFGTQWLRRPQWAQHWWQHLQEAQVWELVLSQAIFAHHEAPCWKRWEETGGT